MGKRPSHRKILAAVLFLSSFIVTMLPAQFVDDFDGRQLGKDPRGVNGWAFFTGDGNAVMDFSVTGRGYASIVVDATHDRMGIWWALIKRRVSKEMDLGQLRNPHGAFRVEARIRVSEAPKRVNLHLNTQRTTDFHTHLMEFDIPDTTQWHTISMTTHGFDAVPGDSVYAQLALMDWGLERYRVDLDYFKVDIVDVDTCAPDHGVQVPYRPPTVESSAFSRHLPVAEDCTIDREYPDLNFNGWCARDDSGTNVLLAVDGSQWAIMRWDLGAFAGRTVAGSGILELTTYSLQRAPKYQKDFGMVRIGEIIGGEPAWNQEQVTYSKLCKTTPLNKVFNSQMIVDVVVNENRDGKNYITISNPVLQRMVEGKTLGLVIRPLGAVSASFFAMENRDRDRIARLHFNLSTDPPVPAK
jgi:hypothetical protein